MKSIREILSGRPPVTIPSSHSVLDAARQMVEARVGALLVVDDSGAPVGVFTERDLMVRVIVAGLDPGSTKVEPLMTRNLFTCPPDRRINEVAREMQERHIRHLPVVENGSVVAMLSLRDLMREHLEVKRNEVQALTSYIQAGEGPHAEESEG